jgi:hypothetical protein
VLVELSVMEQRYQAVLAVIQDGWKVRHRAEDRHRRGRPRPVLHRRGSRHTRGQQGGVRIPCAKNASQATQNRGIAHLHVR